MTRAKKKNRLSADYTFDFELLGIVSSSKEYKLAWHLNQLNVFHLIKSEDIKIEFSDNRLIRVSNLLDETDFSSVYLLKNKLVSSNTFSNHFLIPELQQFDYLLKLSNQTEENWADHLLLRLKEVPIIDYALKINIGKLKAKDNLLF